MKYYSKSPQELRHQFEEDKKNETAKRKRTYIIQIANVGLILVALFLAMKSPYFKLNMKKGNESTDGGLIERSMKWKGWEIATICTLKKHCSLSLVKKAAGASPGSSIDAFYWQVVEKDSDKSLMKSIELIPRDMEADQEKKFKFYLEKEYSEDKIELHFLDNRNDEIFMMQIYP